MSNYLRKLRAGRVSFPANIWVGEQGTLFYDEEDGELRIANGVTPGGIYVRTLDLQSNIADLKVQNVYIDGNLLVRGNTQVINNIINNNQQTFTGNLDVTGTATFTGNSIFSGNIFATGYVSIINSQLSPTRSKLSVTGSNAGLSIQSITSGFMTQVTGIDGNISIITNDSFGGSAARPAYLGRRARGSVSAPTAVLANDILLRLVSSGYANTGFAAVSTRIDSVATENFSNTAMGARLDFGVVRTGTNLYAVSATIDSNGITTSNFYGNTANISSRLDIGGNINLSGTLNLSAGNTTHPPLKFTAETITTNTTIIGAMSFDGNVFTGTPFIGERGVIPTEQIFVLGANLTLGGNVALQSLLGVGSMVSSNTRYWYQIMATINKTVGPTATLSYAIAGNAVLSKHSFTVYSAAGTDITLPATGTGMAKYITSAFNVGTVVTAGMSAGGGAAQVFIFGIIEVATKGTIHPVISFSSAPVSASTQALSKMCIWPMGSSLDSNVSVGSWSP